MRCEHCNNGERRPVRRAQIAERDGRTAVVLDVPVEICDSCGEVWLSMDVAKHVDELFNGSSLFHVGNRPGTRHLLT